MKQTIWSSLAIAVVVTAVLSVPTSAVTPPDNCFAFNSGTGTITDYYNNEANNAANPACPRDVDIPSVVAGVPVTTIGQSAFYNNQLSAVDIPNSVTSIDIGAFAYNKLTSLSLPSGIDTVSDYAFETNLLSNVHIPESVTTIGKSAFSSNRLTQIIIPNSVDTIGWYAFYANQLESVKLSNSIDWIDEGTFASNKLKSVEVPNSVEAIHPLAFFLQSSYGGDIEVITHYPYIYSSEPDEVQQAYDAIWYARLYAEDPSNPNQLTDGVLHEDWWMGRDTNQDGINNSWGGHIINPASIELRYNNSSAATLRTNMNFTGQLESDDYLHDYYVTHGPDIPAPDDPLDITPAEQQAITQAFNDYYRLSEEVTITPPAIDGYVTPPTQTFVLGAATNQAEYTYLTPEEVAAQNTAESEQTQAELADTGAPVSLYVITVVVLLLGGAVLLRRV